MDSKYYNECKILIIDDERDLLNLLETFFKKEGFINIFKADQGKKGVEICKNENPDIVILDVMLPDMDGFEVCRRLREFTYVPILFLSAKEEEVDKILGLGIGGDDYITKPFSLKEVAFRIKAQLRRMHYIENDAKSNEKLKKYQIGNILIDEEKSEVQKNGVSIDLTAKEYQLLLLFAKNLNRIMSKTGIYESIWGEDYLGDDNTIMVHIRHLREKLEDDPGNPKYLITVKGLGYKLVTKGA
ncbi:MAG: response regulator transcription factor [Clostridia bacterium]|nr:response regulator transcription factor [Clostridia bacterium]